MICSAVPGHLRHFVRLLWSGICKRITDRSKIVRPSDGSRTTGDYRLRILATSCRYNEWSLTIAVISRRSSRHRGSNPQRGSQSLFLFVAILRSRFVDTRAFARCRSG